MPLQTLRFVVASSSPAWCSPRPDRGFEAIKNRTSWHPPRRNAASIPSETVHTSASMSPGPSASQPDFSTKWACKKGLLLDPVENVFAKSLMMLESLLPFPPAGAQDRELHLEILEDGSLYGRGSLADRRGL